jgi:hypothetical protein
VPALHISLRPIRYIWVKVASYGIRSGRWEMARPRKNSSGIQGPHGPGQPAAMCGPAMQVYAACTLCSVLCVRNRFPGRSQSSVELTGGEGTVVMFHGPVEGLRSSRQARARRGSRALVIGAKKPLHQVLYLLPNRRPRGILDALSPSPLQNSSLCA